MLKHYIFWGLFALVGLGVVISLLRQRRLPPPAPAPAPVSVATRLQQEEARAAAAKSGAKASANQGVTPAKVPEQASAPAFDPSATRIFVGGVQAAAATGSSHREGAALPVDAAPHLICVGGALNHRIFPITDAGVTIGRDPQSNILLTDPRTSSHHAWIGIVGNQVVLRDLESTNGTFLNAKFDSAITETTLTPGDTIFFGGHGRDQFRFVVE